MSEKSINMPLQMEVEGSITAEPEKCLWIAVLNQAVRDARSLLQKVRKNPDLWTNPLFRSEVLRLKKYFQKESMEPGGFGFICELLEVDAKQAFREIDKQYLRHLQPI